MNCQEIRKQSVTAGLNNIQLLLYWVWLVFAVNPCELELCFTTSHDHKKHALIAIPAGEKRIIKDREKNITILRSDIISGVDYSEGIESNYTLQLKE